MPGLPLSGSKNESNIDPWITTRTQVNHKKLRLFPKNHHPIILPKMMSRRNKANTRPRKKARTTTPWASSSIPRIAATASSSVSVDQFVKNSSRSNVGHHQKALGSPTPPSRRGWTLSLPPRDSSAVRPRPASLPYPRVLHVTRSFFVNMVSVCVSVCVRDTCWSIWHCGRGGGLIELFFSRRRRRRRRLVHSGLE